MFKGCLKRNINCQVLQGCCVFLKTVGYVIVSEEKFYL